MSQVQNFSALQTQETEFEKRRGISSVELRTGFAQVHITNLLGVVTEARLRVLDALGDANISIDFLKLTPTGLSFLVKNADAPAVTEAVRPVAMDFSIRQDQAIVLVHAVNIRDEEGLVGDIVCAVIASGITIEHTGDMHDRLLLVVSEAQANRTVGILKNQWGLA